MKELGPKILNFRFIYFHFQTEESGPETERGAGEGAGVASNHSSSHVEAVSVVCSVDTVL